MDTRNGITKFSAAVLVATGLAVALIITAAGPLEAVSAGPGEVRPRLAGPHGAEVVWQPEVPGVAKHAAIHGRGPRHKLSRAEAEDVAQWASQEGVDVGRALVQYEPVPRFTHVAAKLQAENPETFVDSGVEWIDGDVEPWLTFTDRPDARTVARIQSLPVSVDVMWGAPASKQELEAISGQLLESLAAYYPGDAATSIDRASWSVTVTTDDDAMITDAQLQSAVADAGATAESPVEGPDGQPRPPVTIFHATDELDESALQATVQGGRNMNAISDNAAVCTAGFTAVRNGQAGLLTAAHCPNQLRYGNDKGIIEYTATAADSPGGRNDFQFHRTLSGNSTNAQFRVTSSTDRVVRRVSNPSNGQIVCKWGRFSGYGCATVSSTNRCYTYPGEGTFCGLVAVASNITLGGDSGGPWFFGETATGGHTGLAAIAPFAYPVSVFTEISRVGKVDASVKVS